MEEKKQQEDQDQKKKEIKKVVESAKQTQQIISKRPAPTATILWKKESKQKCKSSDVGFNIRNQFQIQWHNISYFGISSYFHVKVTHW